MALTVEEKKELDGLFVKHDTLNEVFQELKKVNSISELCEWISAESQTAIDRMKVLNEKY